MCVRVNNVHVLLTTFPSLENHVYNKITSQSGECDQPNLSSESGLTFSRVNVPVYPCVHCPLFTR